MSEQAPVKHTINIACTGVEEKRHVTKPARLCAFGDWVGPWGGGAEQDDADQPWHHLDHWIGVDAPRRPLNALTVADPITVLFDGQSPGRPRRPRHTNYPTYKEIRSVFDYAERKGILRRTNHADLSAEELPGALIAAARRLEAVPGAERMSAAMRALALDEEPPPARRAASEDPRPHRLTYDLRCPLCSAHLSARAERLYPALDGLADECALVSDEVLRSMAPKSDPHGMWRDLGLANPPVGPVYALTLSLSELAARVASH